MTRRYVATIVKFLVATRGSSAPVGVAHASAVVTPIADARTGHGATVGPDLRVIRPAAGAARTEPRSTGICVRRTHAPSTAGTRATGARVTLAGDAMVAVITSRAREASCAVRFLARANAIA